MMLCLGLSVSACKASACKASALDLEQEWQAARGAKQHNADARSNKKKKLRYVMHDVTPNGDCLFLATGNFDELCGKLLLTTSLCEFFVVKCYTVRTLRNCGRVGATKRKLWRQSFDCRLMISSAPAADQLQMLTKTAFQ